MKDSEKSEKSVKGNCRLKTSLTVDQLREKFRKLDAKIEAQKRRYENDSTK